jgi:antitoxin VapB
MTVTIKSARVEHLIREVAALSHESLTNTIGHALEERLVRLKGRRTAPSTVEALLQISRRCAALPDLHTRTPNEILGYGDEGAPHGN